MADLISELAARSGVNPELAEKGMQAILALLKDQLPAGSLPQLPTALPPANARVESVPATTKPSRRRLFSVVGGAVGGAVSGAMSKLVGSSAGELTNRFIQLGFSSDQLKRFLPGVPELLKGQLSGDVLKQVSALLQAAATER